MEHSWILIMAMIGHVLCVFADRLLLCTPGGAFSFSDLKDNARIQTLTNEKTVIMIAHRLKNVEHADQILVVDHGKSVQRGTHAQLMQQDGI